MWKIHKHFEIKKHTPERLMSQRRNKKESKKTPKNKQKYKHNIPKCIECDKSSSKRKFIVINVYIKNKERYQIT